MHHTPIKDIGHVTDVIKFNAEKNQLTSKTSKRRYYLIKLLMLIGVSIQRRLSLQRCDRLTMSLILWLIKP